MKAGGGKRVRYVIIVQVSNLKLHRKKTDT